MHISILENELQPWQTVATYQQNHAELTGKFGATNVFVGTMRDFNIGERVESITLEHYPGMTEKKLQQIILAAQQKWVLLDVLLVHRVGKILSKHTIVLIAVWAIHRGDAFDASRYIMEKLKYSAPFWKQEHLFNGSSRWLQTNSSGYQAKKASDKDS